MGKDNILRILASFNLGLNSASIPTLALKWPFIVQPDNSEFWLKVVNSLEIKKIQNPSCCKLSIIVIRILQFESFDDQLWPKLVHTKTNGQ